MAASNLDRLRIRPAKLKSTIFFAQDHFLTSEIEVEQFFFYLTKQEVQLCTPRLKVYFCYLLGHKKTTCGKSSVHPLFELFKIVLV